MRLRHATMTLTAGLALLLAPARAWAQHGYGAIVGWVFPVVGVNLSEDFETVLAERTGAWHTAAGLFDAELIDRRRLTVLE